MHFASHCRFLKNTGAVAGTFAAVGLVVLVLAIILATNVVRRRRARKFDDDVAAAAAEAAAAPRYPFEDFDDPAPGGGYAGGAYSDQESHGTFSQPPMSHGESYNMSEFPGYGAAGIGAAGVGRARSRKDSAGTDLSGPGIAGFGSTGVGARNGAGTAPYPAYATPGPHELYDVPHIRGGGQPTHELLQAAGLAGAGAAGGAYVHRGPSQHTNTSTLSRKQSQGRGLSPEDGAQPGPGSSQDHEHESYAAHYQPDFRPDAHTYAPEHLGVAPPMPNPHSPGAQQQQQFPQYGDEEEDPYAPDSFVAQPQRPGFAQEDSRLSFRDEDDYALDGGRRTLKVRLPP